MDIQSTSYNTIKNSAYGFMGYVMPILFSLIVTPVLIHRLGIVDYGIYVLVNTITAFLSLLDFGFTVSLIKYGAEYLSTNNLAGMQKILNSSNSLYLIIGGLGFLAFCSIGYFFLPKFNISTASIRHIEVIFFLAGLIFFISALNSAYTAIPHALQRFDITIKLTTVQIVLGQLGTLVAVLLGYKLKVIFLVQLISYFGLAVAYRIAVKRLLPQLHFGFEFSREELKKIFTFGSLVAITNFASSALIQLDRILIPIYLGPAQLSYYSLPGSVATKTPGITSSLSGIFFPLSSSLSSKGEMVKLAQIYRRTFRNLTVIAASMTFAVVMFAYKILYFWVGKDFADKSTAVLVILAYTHFILALYTPLTNFLMGLGKVKFLTMWSISLAMINFILLLLLLPKYGIMGAAWAYFLGVLPMAIMFYWTEKFFLGLRASGAFYFKLYLKLSVTTVAAYLISRYLILPVTNSLAALVVLGPLSLVSYAALYKIFGFVDEEDWQLALQFFQKSKQRIFGRS